MQGKLEEERRRGGRFDVSPAPTRFDQYRGIMRNVWIILTLGLTAFLSGERVSFRKANLKPGPAVSVRGAGGVGPRSDRWLLFFGGCLFVKALGAFGYFPRVLVFRLFIHLTPFNVDELRFSHSPLDNNADEPRRHFAQVFGLISSV